MLFIIYVFNLILKYTNLLHVVLRNITTVNLVVCCYCCCFMSFTLSYTGKVLRIQITLYRIAQDQNIYIVFTHSTCCNMLTCNFTLIRIMCRCCFVCMTSQERFIYIETYAGNTHNTFVILYRTIVLYHTIHNLCL